jgi:hypothetical protein
MAKVVIEVKRGYAKVVEKTEGVTVLIKDLDLNPAGKSVDRYDQDQVIGDSGSKAIVAELADAPALV